MKRYLVPVLAGVVVFGGVTAFAATLTVSSDTLGSGDSVVASCNATAKVSYTTAFATGGYKVATTPITTAASCKGLSYKVTLTDASGSLAERTGTLDATTGAATPSFAPTVAPDPIFAGITAASVTGVSVVVTGTPAA